MSTYCWLQRSSALYVSIVLEAQREATRSAVWELLNSFQWQACADISTSELLGK